MEEHVLQFTAEVKKEPKTPPAIIAIESLISFIEKTSAGTLQELIEQLKVK